MVIEIELFEATKTKAFWKEIKKEKLLTIGLFLI